MEELMKEALADWKNPDEYPKWRADSLRRFAWEFLRRNPEYQKDWDDYVNVCRRILPHYYSHESLRGDDFDVLEDHPDHAHYDPPRLKGESRARWLDRVEKGKCTNLSYWYGRKWGLGDHIRNPRDSYEKLLLPFLLQSAHVASFVTEHWGGFNEGGEKGVLRSRVAMAFDLSLPIGPQIEAASRALLSRQKFAVKEGVVMPFPNKAPRKEWIIYLRLLDAEVVRTKPKEMAAQLYPGEDDVYPDYIPSKKVRAALEQAKKWRDSWYRFIPSLKQRKA